MSFDELYKMAKAVMNLPAASGGVLHPRFIINPRRLSEYVEVGGVGSAVLSVSGRVYTGVCIETACSMGFCAEHAAAAAAESLSARYALKTRKHR